jgi:hypothetical protein
MFELAFSRRMCCSRVCSAMRSALLAAGVNRDTDDAAGTERLYSSRVAKKAACGPPKPSGMPKRCDEPSAMSAPMAPGERSSTERHQVGGDGNDAVARFDGSNRAAQIADFAVVVRILEQRAEDFSCAASCGEPKTSSKPKKWRASDHVDGLREAGSVNKKIGSISTC